MKQNDIVTMDARRQVAARRENSIGTILIQAGRLTLEDAERVMRLQNEQRLRFGDAAIQLGLVTPADVEFALSRQFEYPYLVSGQSSVSEQVIAAYEPSSPRSRVLSNLRGQLLLRWFDGDPAHTALAVVSAERGEGRSFVASNLAVAFAQLGSKTLLIDADMRNSVQHVLFGLDNRIGLSAMLAGLGDRTAAVQAVPGLPGLSVLPAGAPPPNPLELLTRPTFARLLHEFAREFQSIVIDSPSAADHSDAQAIAMRAGAALIVVRKNVSRIWRTRDLGDALARTSAAALGTVLNEF